ncbi:MAG TPA: DUF3788 family protein, partial [Bryobacteraceae bacterium]|nr:DUF3788 family protein [Bryobacteraceae bacterium]
VKRKKRNIIYLGPCHNCFLVTFILGEKAMRAARESKLPKRILRLVDEGTRYPEGTAVRIDVKSARDVPGILTLARVKVAN